MAWQQYLPDDRIKWTRGWNSQPIWPTEPDVSVIKNLIWSKYARSTLANPESLQEKEQLDVELFADGAHHKVYNVSHPTWSKPLIFRVAIPLDPALKMESEMATLGYLRERTTIPVPRCVAWGLAADTELGYDWCIMEKLPGVELRDVWRKMAMEKKLELTDRIADILTQLWKPEHKFNQIGSIYVSQQPTDITSIPADMDGVIAGGATAARYAIGPAVDTCYFSGWRRYLQLPRGPFPSCRDWVDNIIAIEREVITTTKTLLDHKEDMTAVHLATDWSLVEDELEIYTEDEFCQEYDEAIKTAQGYHDLLPEVFPPNDPAVTEQPQFFLYHPDFRQANIFVDPDTFEVTGILDWENAMTLPDWYGRDYPLFLKSSDPIDEGIPKVPETFDEHDERYNGPRVSAYDWWELRILRNRYDEALEKLGWKDWKLESPAATAKMLLVDGAFILSTDLEVAKRRLEWVRRTLDGEKEEDDEDKEEGEDKKDKKEGEDKKEEVGKKERENKEEEVKEEEEDKTEGENKKEGEDKERETLVIRVA